MRNSGISPPVEYNSLLFQVICFVRIKPPGATRTRPLIRFGKYDAKSAAMAPPSEYPISVKEVQGMGDDWMHRRISEA